MNNSQQVYFDSGSTASTGFKIKLEQNINTLEMLTLNINNDDLYRSFNADYGVLVGRVIANNGVGVPNAKLSVFIPIDDVDKDNGEIMSIYPYTTPRDKNNDDKRYNLLPRVAKINPITGKKEPPQPFGSFPIKEEVLTNDLYREVYKKYYKYTATSNVNGDYMFFGIPIGLQTIHLSVDITDIGKYSMTPASMVTNLGYSENLFKDNNSKIKESKDLDDLPNIETQEIDVDIISFWGDSSNYEIGINRQDFRIRAKIENQFVLFGSSFTDGSNSMWGNNKDEPFPIPATAQIRDFYNARKTFSTQSGTTSLQSDTVSIATKRTGKVIEKIYYYPNTISDEDIDTGNVEANGTDMLVLDSSEYSTYYKNGSFVYIINCNRTKVLTNDSGQEIPQPNDSNNGVFTEFRGFVTLEYAIDEPDMAFSEILVRVGKDIIISPFRARFKFPQYALSGDTFGSAYENFQYNNSYWNLIHKKFEGGKFYSFAKFHPTTFNDGNNDAQQILNSQGKGGMLNKTIVNKLMGSSHPTIDGSTTYTINTFKNIGIIAASGDSVQDYSLYEFPYNTTGKTDTDLDGVISVTNRYFGANWLNFSIYFPQLSYVTSDHDNGLREVVNADYFSTQFDHDFFYYNNNYYTTDNLQTIGDGKINTKFFARSDLHFTDIIEIPAEDINAIINFNQKGFDSSELSLIGGYYRNASYVPSDWGIANPCPIFKIGDTGIGSDTYFYKGFDGSDCFQFLKDLNIV